MINIEKEIIIEIGKRIRLKRKGKKISVKTLAELVGVSPSTISNIEKARRTTTVFTLWGIARNLKCNSVAELYPSFYFTNDKPKEKTEIQEWEESINNNLNGKFSKNQ